MATVDAAHAKLSNASQYLLAEVWADYIRRALCCEPVPAENVLHSATDEVITAISTASWYGKGLHGRATASGEAFHSFALTAAHSYLPYGTQVRITN